MLDFILGFLLATAAFWFGYWRGFVAHGRLVNAQLIDILRLMKEGRDMVVSEMTELEQREKEMNNGR